MTTRRIIIHDRDVEINFEALIIENIKTQDSNVVDFRNGFLSFSFKPSKQSTEIARKGGHRIVSDSGKEEQTIDTRGTSMTEEKDIVVLHI